MMMHPNLSLVITQGTQRVALLSGYVIHQAAIFPCVPVLQSPLRLLFIPLQGLTFQVIPWEKAGHRS